MIQLDSWHKSEDNLPVENRQTVGISDGFECTTGCYSYDRERWLTNDITAVQPTHVKYWIYMPEEREDE